MILEYVGISLIIIGLVYIFIIAMLARNNKNYPKEKRDELKKFAILIPARYESKVIEDLLISIFKQTKKVNMQDVFVIVESDDDPTVKIAKKYDVSVFVRKDLHLKSKGYALNEVVTYLCKENIYYEAYFILDADNILDKDFIFNMEKSYIDGYDIATGFRNFKNGNDSIIAACSGITFSFLNSNGNEVKSRQSRNITLSGTGLFIVGDLIKKWKCFPFHSLTEDYEMTLYSIENNLTSYYNKEAMFYDEQPVTYKNTLNQRIRWVKGYFDNRKIYIPKLRKKLKSNPNFGSVINEISGMRPYIIMIVGAILYILSQIINIVYNYSFDNFITFISLAKILLIVGLAYALFALMTLFVIKKDIDKLNLSKNMQFKTVLFSPLFFVTYVPCALKALFKKDVKWEKVEHIRRWNK